MGSTIALQYTLDHPEDVSRLALLASLPGLPEEMAEARETQMAFIKSHNLREIAENRVGAAFTESADQGVRARATSPTSRSQKRSTRSSPTGSESQRSLSRSGRRTDSSPSLIDDSTRQQRRALARPIGQRTGVIPGHSQTRNTPPYLHPPVTVRVRRGAAARATCWSAGTRTTWSWAGGQRRPPLAGGLILSHLDQRQRQVAVACRPPGIFRAAGWLRAVSRTRLRSRGRPARPNIRPPSCSFMTGTPACAASFLNRLDT